MKKPSGSLREFEQDNPDGLQGFHPNQRALRARRFGLKSFRLKGHVSISQADFATPATIGQHAGGGLEDVAVELLEFTGGAAPDDPQKDFLDEVIDLLGVPHPSLEVPRQGAAQRHRTAGERGVAL